VEASIRNGQRIYWIADLRRIFGIADTTISRWERKGLIPKRRKMPDSNAVFWLVPEIDAVVERLAEIQPKSAA
jgi:predicted DNA-binding transcriptional regulator AlpA